MKRLALIRARGGSRGLPGKNMRPLGGKPLVQWTIEAAKESAAFSHIAVSSNWDDVLNLAEKLGVIPVRRPESLSSGFATIESVVDHTLGWLRARGLDKEPGGDFSELVLLNPTSPFRTARDIAETVAKMDLPYHLTNAFSVSEHYPMEMTYLKRGPRSVEGAWRASRLPDFRQDRYPHYFENGAVYVIDGKFYREAHRWKGPRIAIHLMPKERSIDIDDAWDFIAAEAYLREMRLQRGEEAE